MRRSQNVCALGLLAAWFVVGQPAFPLEKLSVQGNERLSAETIVAASGLKTGSAVVKEDFDNARLRLLATGAFENVGYSYKPSADKAGYDAVIEVVEVEQVFPYRFEDLPVPDDTLRAALHKLDPILGDRIPATKEVIDKYVAAIQQQVGSAVKVTGAMNNDLPDQLMIVFRPNAPRDQVAEVKFTGNEVLPSPLLIRALAEVAVGTTFSETTMRVLLDSSIRPLYEARGRIRVAFPKLETKPSMTSEGVAVVVTVNEGPSYSLGEVKFTGVSAGDVAEMRKAANLQPKDIANFDEIKAGLDRVLVRYHGKGYLKASGKVERDVDDAKHTVNVALAIDSGAQYTMGKLEITGLDITSEPAIRKIWELKTGAPFRPDYPAAFLDRIRAENIFDDLGKTRPETTLDEKAHVVDVKLYFAGAGAGDGNQRRKKGGQ